MREVEKQPLLINVPKGKLGGVVQEYLEGIPELGIIYPTDRKTSIKSSEGEFVIGIVRATDTARNVKDPKMLVAAAITPSDIAANFRIHRAEQLPIFIAKEKQSDVVLAITTEFGEEKREALGRDVQLGDLSGTTIFTSYATLTEDFAAENNMYDITIEERDGAIEGYPRMAVNSYSIVDVRASGKSLRDNGLEEIAKVHGPVVLQLIFDRSKMTDQQYDTFQDFSKAVMQCQPIYNNLNMQTVFAR